MKNPIRPEQFKNRMARIASLVRTGHCPTLILEWEMRLALDAYHGNGWRAAWHIFRCYTHDQWHMWKSRFQMRVCDRMGWTKVYDIPETKDFIAYKQRHGRKCSGSPNCQNENCIDDSVPRWFRWLTRWDKY